jgi:hypothetical protein
MLNIEHVIDQVTDSRDAIQHRKRHANHRGTEDDSRLCTRKRTRDKSQDRRIVGVSHNEECTGSDEKQRGSGFRNMAPLKVKMTVISCPIDEHERDAKT